MRSILIILFFMLVYQSAKCQKWLPGYFIDVKGNKETGLIRQNPSGKGPIKGEGFIEFKDNAKANPYKLSASDITTFVVGKDSFVVAHAPHNESWTKNETDFVQVVLNEDEKLYATRTGSGGGHRFGISPEVGAGIGSGGYGGLGGGIAINLGGGGGGREQMVYYYGANTAEMEQLTPYNFNDIMSNIMGDEPDVVDKIKANQYNLGNIEKLIAYFKQVQTSHKSP